MKTPLLLLLGTLVVLISCCTAVAYEVGDWTVEQVTNNEVTDTSPQTDGTRIIWSGTGPNGTLQIFMRENGSITQLSDDNPGGTQPRIDTELAAWKGSGQIFSYDGTLHELTPSWETHGQPEVSGHRVAWLGPGDNTYDQVYVNDGIETLRLTETNTFKSELDISESIIVWRDVEPGGSGDIFYHDGVEVHQLTNNEINEKYPKVSHDAAGLHLTYEAYIDGQWDIMHFDGNDLVNITNTPAVNETLHQTCGSRTIWRQYSGGQYRLWLYDGSSATEIRTSSSSISNPQVSESLVVWAEGSWSDIFVFDGSETTQLTDTFPWSETDPQVSGNTIVWIGAPEGGDLEIFTAYLTSTGISSTPELPAFNLHGAFPNPFNPSTEIVFSNRLDETVGIQIYDMRGRLVADLGRREYAPGEHAMTWTGRNERGQKVPSGIYFYRVKTSLDVRAGKVTLVE